MIRPDEVFRIGRLGKVHGIGGELTFNFSDDIFDRTDADFLFVEIDGIVVPFFIEEYRFRSDDLAIIKFEGIDTAEEARQLVNSSVFFPRTQPTGDEEMSLSQLSGYQVIDAGSHRCVGVVTAVDTSTANTLLEVETTDGSHRLIPLAQELIADIDPQQQQIMLHIPEGLLEL